MAQQQVLLHEVLARAHPGQDTRGQQPEEFKHTLSIADPQPFDVLPSHNLRTTASRPKRGRRTAVGNR